MKKYPPIVGIGTLLASLLLGGCATPHSPPLANDQAQHYLEHPVQQLPTPNQKTEPFHAKTESVDVYKLPSYKPVEHLVTSKATLPKDTIRKYEEYFKIMLGLKEKVIGYSNNSGDDLKVCKNLNITAEDIDINDYFFRKYQITSSQATSFINWSDNKLHATLIKTDCETQWLSEFVILTRGGYENYISDKRSGLLIEIGGVVFYAMRAATHH